MSLIDYSLVLTTGVLPRLVDSIVLGVNVPRTGSSFPAQSVSLQIFASADHLLDTSDPLVASITLDFIAEQRESVVIFFLDIRGTAIARGAVNLIARIDPANQIAERNEFNNQALIQGASLGSDVVLEWISAGLSAVMAEGQQGRGVGPTTGTRLMAMLSTAIYDTVCAFNTTQTPYRFDVNAPAGASLQAAVIGAASKILNELLPGQASYFTYQTNTSLAKLAGSSSNAIQGGLSFGRQMADWVLASRAGDGSNNNTPYTPAVRADGYVWTPQLSGPTAGVALGPNWGGVTPFAISNIHAYIPTLEARPDVNYAKYVQEIEEVRRLGALTSTATTTVQRTDDQTQIAKFWAYDRPDTYRPYGQLNQIAVDLSLKSRGLGIQANAALMAALNVALADAVIVAWKAKYSEAQPRPSDLITGQVVDQNGQPVAPVVDTAWKSLLSEINGVQSPPFPDFLSGHSAMGGVFAAVMTKYFGNNRSFDATSQEMPWVSRSQTIKRVFNGFWENGVYRNSFYQAGLEDAISRVYGGVHIREACEDSFNMGQQVGSFVVSQPLFQPA
jgi:hypothetical protein